MKSALIECVDQLAVISPSPIKKPPRHAVAGYPYVLTRQATSVDIRGDIEANSEPTYDKVETLAKFLLARCNCMMPYK